MSNGSRQPMIDKFDKYVCCLWIVNENVRVYEDCAYNWTEKLLRMIISIDAGMMMRSASAYIFI